MKSVLVIGMGRLGTHLATRMQELGNDVMIVDKDEAVIQALLPDFDNAYTGDCTNEDVLRSLGVNNFDHCFVTVGEDFYATLEITSSLKEMGAKCVVSRAKRDRQAKFLKKIGADEVFYPERENAEKLAVRYNSENIFDFVELTSEYSIFEIAILREWIGKTIAELRIRQTCKFNIIAIRRDSYLNPTPEGDYVFREGDHVVVIGKSADVFRISKEE
ncbi:MAG: TrkA family potassium uptake protein [Eubacteriales bacterium]|nr:TrkA family potassium uptake protein [Eubacteriales bacterium]